MREECRQNYGIDLMLFINSYLHQAMLQQVSESHSKVLPHDRGQLPVTLHYWGLQHQDRKRLTDVNGEKCCRIIKSDATT